MTTPSFARDGLVAVLSTQTDFEIVGEAADGRQVVEQALALRPDVILLDLEMPELDGVQALEQLRKLGHSVRAVVFTAFDTDERILSALRAGAKGYLLKGAPREELFGTDRVVHAGGSLLPPVVVSKLLERFSEASPLSAATETLTPARVRGADIGGTGLPNKEIAHRVCPLLNALSSSTSARSWGSWALQIALRPLCWQSSRS